MTVRLHPKAATADAFAEVTFREAGFHRWEVAPERRGYLRATHRHLFHVRVRVRVTHDDRALEFHDLLEACQAEFRRIVAAADGKSCEAMARLLLHFVYQTFGVTAARVEVSEDGEVAGIVGAVC